MPEKWKNRKSKNKKRRNAAARFPRGCISLHKIAVSRSNRDSPRLA
jgi:hypothetical protein